MKKNILKSVLILILLLLPQAVCVVYAQDRHIISDSIYSDILKEQRSLMVYLPDAYKPGSTDKYEVIYVTDGEWAMNPFSFVYKWAQDEQFVPPAIIVALPNTYINRVNQRDRDFLPVHVPEPAISGGADKFLSFIKTEVIPYIDKKYPSNKTKSIYGHSYGGLFVLYTLLTDPQLFDSYYATDPPFRWNNDYLIRMAAEKINSLPSEKILWLAGITETYKYQGIDRLDSVIQIKSPRNLYWKMATFPNEKHNSVRLKAMYDGIKFVYSGYSIDPLNFHPMNGIVIKDKPFTVFVNGASEFKYTVNGTEPDKTSKSGEQRLTITGPAHLVVKSFSTSGKYDKTAKGSFELGEALPSISKSAKIHSGGLNYSYYEGIWDKLPDLKKLKPAKIGIADSTFSFNSLPGKTNFACLFEGYAEIPKDGQYIFVLVSKDGSKLYLGDKLIIDNDGVHSSESVKSFILPLKKGFYPVRLEYFQKGQGSVFQLLYVDLGSEDAIPFPLMYRYYTD